MLPWAPWKSRASQTALYSITCLDSCANHLKTCLPAPSLQFSSSTGGETPLWPGWALKHSLLWASQVKFLPTWSQLVYRCPMYLITCRPNSPANIFSCLCIFPPHPLPVSTLLCISANQQELHLLPQTTAISLPNPSNKPSS